MHQVYLDGSTISARKALFEEVASLRDGPQVFKTFCHSISSERESRDYELVTTTQNIHLQLGRLSAIGLQALCEMLKEEFETRRCEQLFLSLSDGDGTEKKRKWLLITWARGTNSMHDYFVYQIEPVRQ